MLSYAWMMFLFFAPPLDVDVRKGEELPDAGPYPVIFSPDGSSLLYIRRDRENQTLSYARAEADGGEVRVLYRTPVTWDDILCGMIAPSSFSADGSRAAVVTTKGGVDFDMGPAGRELPRPGIVNGKNGMAEIDAPFGPTKGHGFSGEELLVLEGKSFHSPKGGYELVRWSDGKRKILDRSDTEQVAVLRLSPDGTKAAFLRFDYEKEKVSIRVVDAESGKAVATSELYRGDDFVFDGHPLFYWNAESTGIFYNESKVARAKTPCRLMLFDLETEKSKSVVAKEDVGVAAVLDRDHLAVQDLKEDFAAILRISDGTFYNLPEGMRILGGRGRNVVLGRKNSVFAATLILPGDERHNEQRESMDKFLRVIVGSLIEKDDSQRFPIADPVIALDNGEVVAKEDFWKGWQELGKVAFRDDVSVDAFFERVEIQARPVSSNKRIMGSERVRAVYRHQEGDIYCDLSKVKDGENDFIGYDQAFLYIIRKVDDEWVLVGIGG